MIKPAVSIVTTFVMVAVSSACTDRLTAPEAVELVNTVEESLASGTVPQRWVGTIWKSDLRLGAPLVSTDLLRDGEPLPYQAIVFERVVKPSEQLGNAVCAGTRRAAYFWRANSDGVVFFSQGLFDQGLVPALTCLSDGVEMPALNAVTPDQAQWLPESVEGDISPGTVTGTCRFLEPEAERYLRKEHGITCELTNHRVRLAARLRGYAVGGPDSLRLELDATEIIGVRYTIACDEATNKVSPPCFAPLAK